jgi:parallel beta-helix repeat protein
MTVGDNGGSYQTITENRVVNSGHMGIQTGGGSYLTITNNTIYGADFPWSGAGLAIANYHTSPSGHNKVYGNKISWIEHTHYRRDTVWKPGKNGKINDRPEGWDNNTPKAPIDPESMLPKKLVHDSE